MAKKSAASQLVYIPTSGTDKSALSKEQKAFNRLTKRIGKLETNVTEYREAGTRLRQRVQNEYRPLQEQHNDQRAAMVRVLDHAYDTYKLTKTELLKQVTTAYEANELLTLLRLQLELQRIDQSHLENLAEDRLRYYNKLLREQTQELEVALQTEQMDLSVFTGQPWYMLTHTASLEADFQRQQAQLTAKIQQLAAEMLAFEHDPAALKSFLKSCRIPKAGLGLSCRHFSAGVSANFQCNSQA